MTPEDKLILACEQGVLPVVEALVEAGADIHAYDEQAVQIAAKHGHLEVVKYLQEQGAEYK